MNINKKYITLLFSLMAATAPAPTVARKTQKKVQKSNRGKQILAIVGVGVIVMIGGGVYYLYAKKQKMGSTEPNLTPNEYGSLGQSGPQTDGQRPYASMYDQKGENVNANLFSPTTQQQTARDYTKSVRNGRQTRLPRACVSDRFSWNGSVASVYQENSEDGSRLSNQDGGEMEEFNNEQMVTISQDSNQKSKENDETVSIFEPFVDATNDKADEKASEMNTTAR